MKKFWAKQDFEEKLMLSFVGFIVLLVVAAVISIPCSIIYQHQRTQECADRGGLYIQGDQCVKDPSIIKLSR